MPCSRRSRTLAPSARVKSQPSIDCVLEQETNVSKKLYVANLSYSVKGPDLSLLFSRYGGVASADVIRDPETGRSQCFAFVEMGNEREARAARAGLDGHQHEGHAWSVRQVRL